MTTPDTMAIRLVLQRFESRQIGADHWVANDSIHTYVVPVPREVYDGLSAGTMRLVGAEPMQPGAVDQPEAELVECLRVLLERKRAELVGAEPMRMDLPEEPKE